MSEPNFWNDREAARKTIDRFNVLKKPVLKWRTLNSEYEDLEVLYQLDVEKHEVEAELGKLEDGIEELELQRMLGGQDDPRDAILTIHPGAGGTESSDWANMLMRMYLKWIENHGFKSSILDIQPGDEAGIRNATIEVKGEHAYGYLKAEAGVHRLVRISPFDANSRRHTSFASVFVYPEADSEIEVDINDKDLKIETFRSSGAGGQHVNKTDSAIRITHLPTGITVQCQAERSQHRNKSTAMKVLMSRLYQHYKEEEKKKMEKIESQKKSIEWGSQIRSYVFHPYNMVKDHRTGVETSNTQSVMDGEIDEFIREYLIQYPNE